ncbi:trehalose-6-phosphate hydrolase [Caerostris extrusa]|uniref:Trehalose-6-phosphate hydrolase n=1 Tax=Caerostris extrusa TaxID=172846 RepID=A0AAV4RAC3_CAEEX|nr:trehalose-6-phosphate hydrolase [Caerostris extrusa]
MATLNNIVHDALYHKIKSEDLIELPDPKLISNDCTIIMNGHHNYGMSEDKDSCVVEDAEEEVQPFLNHISPNRDPHSTKKYQLSHRVQQFSAKRHLCIKC